MAMAQAVDVVSISKEQALAFRAAVWHEAEQTMWPKGFF